METHFAFAEILKAERKKRRQKEELAQLTQPLPNKPARKPPAQPHPRRTAPSLSALPPEDPG